jgi:hypothetical protein
MIPPVYSLLSADPDVTAIVGDRIGEHGVLFAKELRPYLTWQIAAGAGEVSLDTGRACHDRVTVQVDCWHPDSAGIARLAGAVRTALESESYYVGVTSDGRDAETLLYQFGMYFDFIL